MSYAYFGDLEEHHSKFNPATSVETAPSTAVESAEPSKAQTAPSTAGSPPPLVEDLPYESDGHYDKMGPYLISTLCLGSYPCKHNVIDLNKGEKMYLNAVAIYERLQGHGMTHPHFEIYKDYAKIEL